MQDIFLYINSPGGSVTAGMAIYDTMQFIKPNVATLCLGQACSMGAFLLAGGHAGKRYCLPNSRVMIHQPLGGYQGTLMPCCPFFTIFLCNQDLFSGKLSGMFCHGSCWLCFLQCRAAQVV